MTETQLTDLPIVPPRCAHGNIILGCPEEPCPDQDAYLADMNAKMAGWDEQMQRNARNFVRGAMGLPPEEPS